MEQDGMNTSYRLPLFKSLTEVFLLAGAPRDLAIFNGTIAVMFIILHAFYVLPLNVIIHIVGVYLGKKDPQCVACFSRYMHKKKYYST